jgi:nitrous oxidase accessory protein NosD
MQGGIMQRVFALLLPIVMVMAVAPPVAADTSAIVRGTNSFPADLDAVQAAVDQGGTVVLDGTFDFGDGLLLITNDVRLNGTAGSVIRNGGVDGQYPAIVAVPPADHVVLRGLTMMDADGAALLTQVGHPEILNNSFLGAELFPVTVIGAVGGRVSGNQIDASINPFAALYSDGLTVRNNHFVAFDVGIFLLSTGDSTFAENEIAIVGDSNGFFDVGRTAVFLAPDVDETFDPPVFLAGDVENRFSNNRLAGEMTYGYLLGEGAEDSQIRIAPRNLDDAVFIPPPVFPLCDGQTTGAAVLLIGETDFGPASSNNFVRDLTGGAAIIDCGDNNSVR